MGILFFFFWGGYHIFKRPVRSVYLIFCEMCYYLGPGRSKKIQIRYHVGMNSLTRGAMLTATSSCYFWSLILAITNVCSAQESLMCHTMFLFITRSPIDILCWKQLHGSKPGFFSLLWCSHTANHPQEDLARIGYKTGRMVIVSWNPAAVLQPAGAGTLNLSNPIQKHCFSGFV